VIARRYLLPALVVAFAIWLIVATRDVKGDTTTTPTTTEDAIVPMPSPSSTPVDPVRDLAIVSLKRQLKHERMRVRALKRTLMHRPSTREALDLACSTYGSCSTLWRRASCESHLNASARNAASSASGLFQFLPSTFSSTPYGRLSIWSPYANAMAAGWMIVHGRGGEWVCR